MGKVHIKLTVDVEKDGICETQFEGEMDLPGKAFGVDLRDFMRCENADVYADGDKVELTRFDRRPIQSGEYRFVVRKD